MSRIIREARPTDMAEIMHVMDAAKKIMRQSAICTNGEMAIPLKQSFLLIWRKKAVL
jgi:hypothetical protein